MIGAGTMTTPVRRNEIRPLAWCFSPRWQSDELLGTYPERKRHLTYNRLMSHLFGDAN